MPAERSRKCLFYWVRPCSAGIAVIFTWLASRFNYDRNDRSEQKVDECDFICSLADDVSVLGANRRHSQAPLFAFINGASPVLDDHDRGSD
jgi:hypothetical protein